MGESSLPFWEGRSRGDVITLLVLNAAPNRPLLCGLGPAPLSYSSSAVGSVGPGDGGPPRGLCAAQAGLSAPLPVPHEKSDKGAKSMKKLFASIAIAVAFAATAAHSRPGRGRRAREGPRAHVIGVWPS
jgi:hypothetical protein